MSSMLPPASSTAAFKFSQTCRVCASMSMRMFRYCQSHQRKLEIKSQPISENIAIGSRFDMASEAIFEFRSVEGRLLELLLRIRERLHFEHHERVAGHVRGHHRREVAFECFQRAELEHTLEAHGMRDCRIIVAA